jgi:alpha-galactosidase
MKRCFILLSITLSFSANAFGQDTIGLNDSLRSFILTPSVSDKPRINGAKVYGVTPNAPFLYAVPVSGKRPMQFSITYLPKGLKFDSKTGIITGKIEKRGQYTVNIIVKNSLGSAERRFTIVVGDDICLTPPMGWNSWNCWGSSVDQNKVLRSAIGFIKNKLNEHGWTYINIDDAWQGERGGILNALQPDLRKFPNMKALCDSIHSMGLKVGIYSTPWVRSYAGRLGGSSENTKGQKDSLFTKKVKANAKLLPWAIGKYSFAANDAQQFANWGIDYLKYDWAPVEVPETKDMAIAIKNTGRDMVLSLSNNASQTLIHNIAEVAPFAQSWRTTTDINDTWKSMSSIGFSQDKWAIYTKPGHYSDPDMLVVGYVGWGKPHPTRLTPDEQYTHFSLWCLLSAPLLLGCDLDKLDAFTLNLITNDEFIDIDQDPLCRQATRVYSKDSLDIFSKPLEDGSSAVGMFNKSSQKATITANWKDLGITGSQTIRDIWLQKNVQVAETSYQADVASHGVKLIRIIPNLFKEKYKNEFH